MRQKCTMKDIWGIAYPALMYLGIMYLVQILILFVTFFMMGFQFSEQIQFFSEDQLANKVTEIVMPQMLLISTISAFVTVPIGILLMYFDKLKEKELGIYRKYTGHRPFTYMLILPLAFTAMLAGNYLIAVVQVFLPQEWIAVYDDTAEILYSGSVWIQILATVISAPIIEEIIFRGLVYKRIRRVSNSNVAIFLSALIFGIFHWNVVQGIYAFVVGLILAYIYEKYKMIFAPILFHMIANLMSVMVTYMSTGEEIEEASQQMMSAAQMNVYLFMLAITGGLTIGLLVAVSRMVKVTEVKAL